MLRCTRWSRCSIADGVFDRDRFRPGSVSLYSRVLLAVRLADAQVIPGWAYVASGRHSG